MMEVSIFLDVSLLLYLNSGEVFAADIVTEPVTLDNCLSGKLNHSAAYDDAWFSCNAKFHGKDIPAAEKCQVESIKAVTSDRKGGWKMDISGVKIIAPHLPAVIATKVAEKCANGDTAASTVQPPGSSATLVKCIEHVLFEMVNDKNLKCE